MSAGVVQCGVTVAVPAQEIHDASPADLQTYFRELGAQLLPKLREHVGGARPLADPAVNVQGPVQDTFQGVIYALSLAAPFYLDDLPTHCPAYQAHYREGTPNA